MNPIDKACELIKQPGDSKRIFIDNIEIFKEIYSRKASYINELDKKSFEVVLFMIENEEQEIFEYFHEDIISMIKKLQEEVCFELRINKKPTDEDIDKIFENIYFHEELSKKLSNLKILESTDDFTKGTVKSYINSTIYRDSISALIIAINKSYFSLSPEKISQVIKYIKTSDWIKRYSEGLEKNVMLDRDFAYQYIDKFLSIKEFCIDEEAKDDILLNGILTGKIKDKKLLYQSLDKLAIETVVYFYDEDLNNLFKSLENIDYLSEMEKQEIFIKVSNKLLDEKKYIYLYRLLVSNDNPYFNMYFKKEKDKIIYYALNDNPLNLSEKEINYLIENGYATTNFLDNVKSVYSRVDEIESMDIAIERLRKGIFEPNEIDDKTLKQIIRKIINECLKSFDIDIGNKIIFCDSKIDDGYYTIDQCLIMINNNLITKFIEKKDYADLFITIFHEMRHAIQFNKIQKNDFDYDTYVMLKDYLIDNYCNEYYHTNYYPISYEMDARKDSYKTTFKFLEEYIPEILDAVQQDILTKEKSEKVYKNTHERIIFNKLKKENLDDVFDRLIKIRPEILKKYPIFNIEYNPDGTLKTYSELLETKNEIVDNIIQARNMHGKNKTFN